MVLFQLILKIIVEYMKIALRFCALLIGKLINRVGGKIFLPKQRKILDKLRFLNQRKIIKVHFGKCNFIH